MRGVTNFFYKSEQYVSAYHAVTKIPAHLKRVLFANKLLWMVMVLVQ